MVNTRNLKTPFIDFLPPLASHEFEALKNDIAVRGVLHPVCVDEDDNILDGHHRYKVDKRSPVTVIKGLSEAEKIAFVLSSNNKRRNLTPEQRGELRKRNIETAKKLKEEDPKKWTQAKISAALGVSRTAVEEWFISNDKSVKANKDARLSVPESAKTQIISRVKKGEPQRQVAADFGITQGRVSQIVTAAKKKTTKRKELDAIASKSPGGLAGDLVRDWKKHASGRATVGFFPRRTHAMEAHEMLSAAGIRSAYLDGETGDDERLDRAAALAASRWADEFMDDADLQDAEI